MTRDEQKQFIVDCLEQTKAALLAKVERAPEDWDGHELRAWIEADVSDRIGRISLIRKEPKSKRAKDFRNTMLALNL